ncbi:MAG: ATP-binding cassette domain-containing protein [Bacteriovoracaceae bacterium]|nr:ATP-binding cassette domain-containing protein [Bacteriovoracaceae bacterium]
MYTQRYSSPNQAIPKIRPVFHFDQVSVDFGKIKALRSVQLSVLPKEILFVTGASGAGKSTLLNMMAGLVEPTSGKIHRLQDDSKFFVASVFQDLRLWQEKTCEQNMWISYDARLYDSREQFHKEMLELARVLGVYEHMNQKISDCNGGLKSKVAMIRALLSKPDALLADEPTAALDREASFRLFELLNHYNQKKGLTLVWATHNREMAKQFPGKVAHLDGGRLMYSGQACFI